MAFKVKRKQEKDAGKHIRYVVKLKIPKMYRGWNGSAWRHFSSDQVIYTYSKGPNKGIKVVKFIDRKEKFAPRNITEVKKYNCPHCEDTGIVAECGGQIEERCTECDCEINY